MITIKKVAVTPLPENSGTIIDSFNTSDDKHTNAPSLNAVENYVQRKVLSGTAEPTSNLGSDGDIYFQYVD